MKISCLVGTNGAGKSTILQAMDFVHHLALGDIEVWLKTRGWKLNELTSRLSKKKMLLLT
ncbi:ATP-binding cassette domain-containing protein [Sphaerochaeta halotolerans]|uniref:ATP-binding cassette domain-containing protein n=1 Tax=Sphaerochaeta halotolerans TaxID=2293840 RepID=A0A372MK25_9SPIR|nr:ATP-binding cassette domain-containing protein [Sphaerochaeta halotolerans]